MTDLEELKEWLRIDGTDDDNTLTSLLLSSSLVIKQSTGVVLEDVQDNLEALALYKLVQKLIITDLYENRSGSGKINPVVVSLYTQLEAYKLQGDNI